MREVVWGAPATTEEAPFEGSADADADMEDGICVGASQEFASNLVSQNVLDAYAMVRVGCDVRQAAAATSSRRGTSVLVECERKRRGRTDKEQSRIGEKLAPIIHDSDVWRIIRAGAYRKPPTVGSSSISTLTPKYILGNIVAHILYVSMQVSVSVFGLTSLSDCVA